MAGDFSFWQQQPQHAQLPETQPWFAENATADVTPEELALLQRLNGETTMWWAEAQASIAPVQQATQEEWATTWWNGIPDMGVADAPNQEVKPNNEWSSSAWNWSQGIDMKSQMEVSPIPPGLHPQAAQDIEQFQVPRDSMWPWEQDQMRGQDDASIVAGLRMGAEGEGGPPDHTNEDDPDNGLAAEMSAQVALFLAGGDFEEESEDEDVSALPEPALGGETNREAALAVGSMTINAPPFVPASLQTGTDAPATSNARTELRLDEILPKEANPLPLPTSEGLSDFIDVLHRRPLPPDLEDPKNFKKFEAEITKAVLNFYKKQVPPTVKMLQKELREWNQIPEDWLNVLLQVCVRDTAKLYYIKPPMRGEQPIIYLAKPPVWFQGFVPSEADLKEYHEGTTGRAVMPPVPEVAQQTVPVAENSEVKESKRRQPRNASMGNAGRKSAEKPQNAKSPSPMDNRVLPLMPGAVNPMPLLEARFKKADIKYSADMNGRDEVQGNLDVSGLLEELMLAFPHGIRFSMLKEQLRTSNEGSFGETAFSCPKIAQIKIEGSGGSGGSMEANQPSNPILQEAMTNQEASGKPWQWS